MLVIADVCGKGVAAALRMAMLRDAFRSEAVLADGAKGLVVENDGRRLRYARAGHPPLLAIRRGARPKPIHCQGAAIGFSDGLIETLNRKKDAGTASGVPDYTTMISGSAGKANVFAPPIWMPTTSRTGLTFFPLPSTS